VIANAAHERERFLESLLVQMGDEELADAAGKALAAAVN
jgi:hypothetical protein